LKLGEKFQHTNFNIYLPMEEQDSLTAKYPIRLTAN